MSAIAQKSRAVSAPAPARAAVSAQNPLPTIETSYARKLPDGRWVGTGKIEDLNRELRDWAARVGKADVILLDRPWAYGKEPGAPGGESWYLNPEFHYPLIADRDNIKIALRDVLKPNAEVYEWVPSSQVPFLLKIWAAAGVKYIGMAAWNKLKETGSPHECSHQIISNCHEMLVVGRVGKGVQRIENAAVKRAKGGALSKAQRAGLDGKTRDKDGRTPIDYAVKEAVAVVRKEANVRIQRIPGVFTAPAGEHSRKPAMLYEWIRSIYGRKYNYGEIFCRGSVPGWNVFGNQAAEDAA